MTSHLRHRALRTALALAFTCAATATTLAAADDGRGDQKMSVQLDRATLMTLPEHVDTIVVGNPIIADVTMLKRSQQVVITGKSFGETNVIFLDNAGKKQTELLVSVREARGLLTVQRGLERESYSCLPRCEPTIALGDSTKFLSEASSQVTSRNGLAAPGK